MRKFSSIQRVYPGLIGKGAGYNEKFVFGAKMSFLPLVKKNWSLYINKTELF